MNTSAQFPHQKQLDSTLCGPTCLSTILQHFGCQIPRDELIYRSGTSRRGSTMLGLLQAANFFDLIAEGFEADLKSLSECEQICILHLIKENGDQHFVTYWGYDEQEKTFIIGDPAEDSIAHWSADRLSQLWKSKNLLLLKPSPTLKPVEVRAIAKIEWLKSLLNEDLNLLFVAVILGSAVAVLGISTALFSQRLLDDFLLAEDTTRLYMGIFFLFILLTGRAGINYIREYFLIQQSKAFNIRLIDHFYRKLLDLPKAFFDSRKTGDMVARLNDTQRIQQTVSRLASGILIDFVLAFVISICIVVYHWQIGLLTLLWIPIFTYLVYWFHPKIVKSQREVMANHAQNESNYIDTIQGIQAIKLNNAETIFSSVTKLTFANFQEAVYKLGKVSIHFGLLTDLLSTVFVIAVIGFCSVSVWNTTLSIGSMMAILMMIGLLMSAARNIAIANIQIQEAKVAFERMLDFIALRSETEIMQPEGQKALDTIDRFESMIVKQLSFRFPGHTSLLHEVNFEIKRGEWISILGESGCGKSTLLQIIQRLYSFQGGQILINNQNIEALDLSSWRSCLGVVSQDMKIFNGSLLDNILMGTNREDVKKIEAFFEYYGFDKFFLKFPQGYATMLGESGTSISVGQRQLVVLARAIYHQPDLLLLDEPTSALDRNTEAFVLNLLHKLNQEQKTIILLTHRIRTAREANRIYIIEDGHTNTVGQHEELLLSDNLYSRTWKDLVSV